MNVTAISTAALAFLLVWTAKATVLLAVAGAAAFVLNRRSAALRHQIWTIAIIGSLALPLLAISLPEWHPDSLRPIVAFFSPGAAVPASAATPAATQRITVIVSGRGASLPATAQSYFRRGATIALVLWTLGAAIILFRLLAGLAHLARIAAYSKITHDRAWLEILANVRENFGVRRPVRLLESAKAATMPMTWGILHPCIILPAGISEWTEERRRIVLSHEMAHVARRDWSLQICGELLRACFWFHPLAWFAASRLRHESERACDDTVLNSGIAAPEYAGELLALAQTLAAPRQRFSLALAIARPSSLERRFSAMLNPSTKRGAVSARSRRLALFLAALVLLPLAALSLAAEGPSRVPKSLQGSRHAEVLPLGPRMGLTVSVPVRSTDMSARAGAPLPNPAHQSSAAPQSAVPAPGSISGVVRDPSGAVVPRATVTLTNTATGEKKTVDSQPSGDFAFAGLAPGAYDLEVAQTGFRAYRKSAIELSVGEHVSLRDVNLTVAEVSIQVSAQPRAAGLQNHAPVYVQQEPIYACNANAPAAAPVPATQKPGEPAAQADTSKPVGPVRVRVGGMVIAARAMYSPPAAYPDSARADGIQGSVILHAVIFKDGTPHVGCFDPNAQTDPRLVQSAVEAVRQWRFEPALLNGEPVEVVTDIEVRFQLSQ
jgi:TonB family protein